MFIIAYIYIVLFDCSYNCFCVTNFRTTSRSDFTFYADRLVSWILFLYHVVCNIKPSAFLILLHWMTI